MKKKTSTWFRVWRKNLKLTQKEAAFLLGLKPRMLQNYESGSHPIPLYIRLAMASLSQGVVDYQEGLMSKPDQPLPVYAADGVAKLKAAEKVRIKALEAAGESPDLAKSTKNKD